MRTSARLLAIIISLAVILLGAGGATVAYIFSQTEAEDNVFDPVFVACSVVESFDGVTKENVRVRNDGGIPAFIRATYVVTWCAEDGSVYSSIPVEGVDYSFISGSDKWVKGSDGFYYYTHQVAAGAVTENLIGAIASLGTAPSGYSLNVRVMASAIQAEPAAAVTEAWGATANGAGALTPP